MTRAGGGGGGKSRRGLSQEDAALWSHVGETCEPVRRLKQRVPAHVSADEDAAPSVPLRTAVSVAANGSDRSRPVKPPAPIAPPANAAPPLAEFDRKKAKKIAAGREAIDARIDLHGMRQSEAHFALRAFLLSCHADGRRNVLVITGKGVDPGDDDATRPFAMDARGRGVLRRNVPIWLAEPELRAIVVSYRDAARGHGGAGALYVHLRARRRR